MHHRSPYLEIHLVPKPAEDNNWSRYCLPHTESSSSREKKTVLGPPCKAALKSLIFIMPFVPLMDRARDASLAEAPQLTPVQSE